MDATTTPAVPTPSPRSGMPIPMEAIVQVVGFVGAAVMTASVSIAFGSSSTSAQVLAELISLVVFLGAGWAVGVGPDAYRRMQSVFWFFAVISWSDLAGRISGDTFGLDGKAAAFTTGLLVAIVAAAIWFLCRRSLQVVAMFGAVYVTVIALAAPDVSNLNPTGALLGGQSSLNVTGIGVAAWLVGIALIALAVLGVVEPKRTAFTMGSLGAVFGPVAIGLDLFRLVFSQSFPTGGLALALVTSIAVLVLGEMLGERVLSGFGIVGTFFFSGTLVSDHVHDKGPGAVLLLVGLAALAAAVLVARGAIGRPPIPPAPTPAPAAAPEGPMMSPPGPTEPQG